MPTIQHMRKGREFEVQRKLCFAFPFALPRVLCMYLEYLPVLSFHFLLIKMAAYTSPPFTSKAALRIVMKKCWFIVIPALPNGYVQLRMRQKNSSLQ